MTMRTISPTVIVKILVLIDDCSIACPLDIFHPTNPCYRAYRLAPGSISHPRSSRSPWSAAQRAYWGLYERGHCQARFLWALSSLLPCFYAFFCSTAPPAFFRPDRRFRTPARAEAVKVGRRSGIEAHFDVSRPRLV